MKSSIFPGWLLDFSRTCGYRCYRLAQRLMILDISHLMLLETRHVRKPDPPIHDLTLRFLTPQDLRSLSEDCSNELEPALADRLTPGLDVCFGTFQGDTIAGYVWFAFGSIDAEYNRGASIQSGVGLSFPQQMAFLYKGFVHPNYRGQKLYGHMIAASLQALSKQGITQILSTADWTNVSALKSCYTIGYEFLGCIWRFGCRWRMLTVPPKKVSLLGITTAEE